MGKCSYSWEEWDSEKGTLILKKCHKETWKGSDKYCIFHDPSPEKDVDLFKEKLEEQMKSESGRHNFIGYYFPANWDFSGKEFETAADFSGATFQDVDFKEATFQDVDFGGATFQGTAILIGATFQGTAILIGATFQGTAHFRGAIFQDADFGGATFQGTADFSGATFQGTADFSGATFRDAYFGGTTFQHTYFWGATFNKKAELVFKNVGKLDLRNSEFLSRSYITTNLEKAMFHRAFLEHVAFIDCTWPDRMILYEEKHMNDKNINLSDTQLETIYRDLKQNMQRHGDYRTAGELYYREMEMRRKRTKAKKKRLWLELYRLLAGYGEKPERTAFSSFITVLTFAALYLALECLKYPMRNPTILQKVESVIYFSFVTFTTLGLGDIEPVNVWGRTLICCEAVIGAFLIALFVVVFARKMIR